MQPPFFDSALGNDALELDWTLFDNGIKELNGGPSNIYETGQLADTFSTVCPSHSLLLLLDHMILAFVKEWMADMYFSKVKCSCSFALAAEKK